MANTADDWLYNDDLDVSLPGVRIDIPDLAIMFMIVQHKCILLPLISLLSHFIRPLDTMGICLSKQKLMYKVLVPTKFLWIYGGSGHLYELVQC